MEFHSPGAAAEGSVRIGAYSLDVTSPSGSFARFEPKVEQDNAQELAAALAEVPDAPPAAVAAIEEFQESADAVTSRIERADNLLRTAAAGNLLQIDNLSGEIDALVDLFARLDKAGRFEEELKLMRSLNGLLALTLRWLELIRSLLALLRSAQAAGHAAGAAFAHNELGALHLCAGRAEEAERHLAEAMRLQDQIGDLAGRCATRHNLDSARRDALAGSGSGGSRRRLLRSAALAAAFVLLGGGGGTGLALAIRGGGGDGSGGDHSPAALIVHKDFAPNAPAASVAISVTCTKGSRPDKSPRNATEAAPAVFAISGLGKGATCTATEGRKLAAYVTIERDCRDVSIAGGDTRSCTITNRRKGVRSANLIVHKDFVPNAPSSSVEVSVTCTQGGRPDRSAKRVTEIAPASFKITSLKKGATCTASESPAPSGYSQNNDNCRSVSIAPGSSVSCTIVNTRSSVPSAIFEVSKDFSDDNPAKVSIDLTCSSGRVTKTPLVAFEGSPVTFAITGFGSGTTCTASEGTASSGYTADEGDCQRVAIADGGSFSCTIVDTLNLATLTVGIDFTDGSTRAVSVSLTCSSGTIDRPKQGASHSRPAEFTITGFETGATCSTTEDKLPSSYTKDESDCQDVPLASRGECTIVNSPTG